ncbi:acyl-CoA dehydrogenase family protein [Nocardioides daphniae]|uniref:acyl-CoA dehydrogenase family protein n=1 Tax=Nocardioides daphniae TaxID=402297 RepID=UPI0023B02C15|nr:acyl-CoA dehydrogenase family protein [Nocardioides daphniae]
MADNRKPNSLEASMSKAKAGRVGSAVTLGCVELAGTLGYSETELLEKWSRDSKILDIFEGTADPAAHRGATGPRAVERRAQVRR